MDVVFQFPAHLCPKPLWCHIGSTWGFQGFTARLFPGTFPIISCEETWTNIYISTIWTNGFHTQATNYEDSKFGWRYCLQTTGEGYRSVAWTWHITFPETDIAIAPEKMKVPFGTWPIFRGELLVSGSAFTDLTNVILFFQFYHFIFCLVVAYFSWFSESLCLLSLCWENFQMLPRTRMASNVKPLFKNFSFSHGA